MHYIPDICSSTRRGWLLILVSQIWRFFCWCKPLYNKFLLRWNFCNSCLCRLAGYPEELLVGMNFWGFSSRLASRDVRRICMWVFWHISSRGWLVILKVLVCWCKSLYKFCHVETAASLVREEWRSRDIMTREGKVFCLLVLESSCQHWRTCTQ